MAIKFLSGLNLSNVTAGSILKLDSSGNIVAAVDGTDYNTGSADSWSATGSDIYRNSDVRIGTYQSGVAPSARLHVFDYQTTDPKLLIEDGNTGDASMQFKVSTQQYTMGIDNSDSDNFIIANASGFNLAANTHALEINTAGKVTIPTHTSHGTVRLELGGYNRLRFNGGIDLLGYSSDHLWVIGNSGTNTINLGGDWDWDKQVAISYQPNTVGNAGGVMILGQTEKNNANWTHGITKLYTNGTERLRVDSSGNVKVYGGDLDLRDPNEEDATNVLYFNANNGNSANDSNDIGTGIVWKPDYTGYTKRSAGIMQIGEGNYFKSGLAFYTNNTSNNSTDWSERMRLDMDGNLGIGTSEPSYKLHVEGNVGITEYLQHKGDNNTYLRFSTDLIRLAAGGVEMIRLLEDATQDAVVINEGGADVDFRVESDTDTHAFFVQGSDGYAGFGTSTPNTQLHVDGTITVTGASLLRRYVSGWSNATTHDVIYNGWTETLGDYVYLKAQGNSTSGHGMMLVGDNVAYIGRSDVETGAVTGLDQTWATFKNGGVGIGTTSPSEKLHVVGNAIIDGGNGDATLTIKADADNSGEDDNPNILFSQDGGNVTSSVGFVGTAGQIYTSSLGNAFYINTGAAGVPIQFSTNDSAKMTIEDGGNIGMGTNNPDVLLHLYRGTSTGSSTTGTTLMKLENYVGGDLQQQKSFVDFIFKDDNNNETPQVRIGAEVGNNGNADSQAKEGMGAFVVYTNNADTDAGDAGASLAERFRVDRQGRVGIGSSNPAHPLHVVGDIYTTSDFRGNSIISTNTALSIDNTGIAPDQGEVEDIVAFKHLTTKVAHVDTDGYISAAGFKTNTASTGLLKANGTVDTTSYLTSSSTDLDSRYYTETELNGFFKSITHQGNYISTADWSLDGSGSVDNGWSAEGYPFNPTGTFVANGSGSENNRILQELPNGAYGVVWRTPSNDASSDADGGWDMDINNVHHSKAYRSIVMFQKTDDSTSGTFYHGCHGSHTLNLSGTANTNPYFQTVNFSSLVQGRWYVSVGYIQPYQYPSATDSSRSGIYDCYTGKKVVGGTDYMMKSGSTTQRHRTYQYYSTDTNSSINWWNPRFEEINGNEPSIAELIQKVSIDGELGLNFHSKFPAGALDSLTEATDATNDKILLWDESADVWKQMTLEDLQDSIDQNTTYSVATTSADGLMSSTDKTKLDGVATNADVTPSWVPDSDPSYLTTETYTGTVTSVTVGTGLDVSNGTTTPSITLDLSELTDMTANVNTSQDELILLDNGAERRKLFSEIFGSAAYSNTSAFAAASHNHDGVYPAKTDSYISLYSDSWGNTPEGKYIQVDLPYRSGSGSSAYYVFDVFGFRDIGQMDSMVNYRVYAHTRSNGTEINDVKFRVYRLHDQQGEFFEFAYKTQTGSATQFFIYIEEDYSGAEIFGLPLDQGEFAKLTSSMISSTETAPSGTTGVTAEVAHPRVGTTAGTYGNTANGTKIDTITIDEHGHVTAVATGATGNMTGFFVEDGDGTEVQITNAKEWKFVEGTGIDINWTDTSTGNDSDPYDLTFAVKNNSIGIDQLNVSDGTNGQVLTTNGSGTLSFSTVVTSVAFSDLTSTPTTVSGYGITDAVSSSDVAFSLSGDDITIGDSLTLAGGLTYTDSTSTLSLSLTSPVSGDWWNGGYTKVGTDGVMEIGKYIDWHDTDTETDDFSYRMTANNGRMYFSGDIEVDGGDIYITDGNTRLHEGNNDSLRVTTPSGYIEIGAMNTSHCHIQTDRSNFYFNNEIRVDSGIIGSYNEDLLLRRAGTTKITCAASTTTIEDNTVINGTLEATAKSFNIEHPTKEGKRLVYGSLEGAEHGVYFRGKGTGEVIELPDHWTGLVHEDSITVQLTPIGKNCVWVEDIKDNSVHVGMDNDTPYFYFIQAERKDIDKLIVEQDA